jgi:hypothetical protein
VGISKKPMRQPIKMTWFDRMAIVVLVPVVCIGLLRALSTFIAVGFLFVYSPLPWWLRAIAALTIIVLTIYLLRIRASTRVR